MEYLGTIPENDYKLILPKCGNKRNVLECYSTTEKQLAEEDKCINTLDDGLLETKQEALTKLLTNHPFPIHQGPFERNINGLQYNCSVDGQDGTSYTFYTYTTFVHKSDQPCKVWSINSQHIPGEPKHVLTFTTDDVLHGVKLWGPACDHNMSIMYNCNMHGCVIRCPCTVCEAAPSKPQCQKHHVDLQRKFNLKYHSFTVPCSSDKLLPLYKDRIKHGIELHTGHKYPGIPRGCQQCRLELLDHQIHHHGCIITASSANLFSESWKRKNQQKTLNKQKVTFRGPMTALVASATRYSLLMQTESCMKEVHMDM